MSPIGEKRHALSVFGRAMLNKTSSSRGTAVQWASYCLERNRNPSIVSQFNSTLSNTHQSHGITRSDNSYQRRVSSEHTGYLHQDCDYLQHRRFDANSSPDAFSPTYNGRRDTDDVRTVRDQANVGKNRSRVNYLANASGA